MERAILGAAALRVQHFSVRRSARLLRSARSMFAASHQHGKVARCRRAYRAMKSAKAKLRPKQAALEKAAPFDQRDFRRALGQFATGVTVVTALAKSGRPVGLTVNSFASVSLDPPLVLWSLSRQATEFADLNAAGRFAVNVLSARQHHLSRQFATTLPDKFSGVEYERARDGSPLLNGATAQFMCRVEKRIDGGDHVIILGEVEEYRWKEGEPLVFHAGRYHVTTRHPDLPE